MSIANSFGAKVVIIESTSFNHGLTRNLGVSHASGDLIYFTVQDAQLSCSDTLERMTQHFMDKDVQAVVGIQGCPHDLNKNPAIWFNQIDVPVTETRNFPDSSFLSLSQQDQFELSNWDNVNAMYRKKILEKMPFSETNFSEDWIWANAALKYGVKILRDPSILTWHYHHMSFGYTLRNVFIVNYYFKVFFDQIPRLNLSIIPLTGRIYTLIFKRNQLNISQKSYWIIHNLFFFIAKMFSSILFLSFNSIFRQKGLNWLFRLLCKKIPQGATKS